MYNAKNYTEQGGDVTHIGGKLVIEEGAQVEGLPSPTITKAANQAASEASTIAALKEDFNGLLSKLKAAGLMEADEENEPAGEPEVPAAVKTNRPLPAAIPPARMKTATN